MGCSASTQASPVHPLSDTTPAATEQKTNNTPEAEEALHSEWGAPQTAPQHAASPSAAAEETPQGHGRGTGGAGSSEQKATTHQTAPHAAAPEQKANTEAEGARRSEWETVQNSAQDAHAASETTPQGRSRGAEGAESSKPQVAAAHQQTMPHDGATPEGEGEPGKGLGDASPGDHGPEPSEMKPTGPGHGPGGEGQETLAGQEQADSGNGPCEGALGQDEPARTVSPSATQHAARGPAADLDSQEVLEGDPPGKSDAAAMDMELQTFQRFDADGDGIIQRDEMAKAVVHLGLVPFGGSKDEVVEKVLLGLGADENGCVPYEKFKANYEVIESIMASSGIDYEKAEAIHRGLLHELGKRGCLIGEDESPLQVPIAHRAVSLEVVHALASTLGLHGFYDLPTFNYAIRMACTGPAGEQIRFTDLLSPAHVAPPTAFISHMWMAPLGAWPGDRPFTYTSRHVLEHYRGDELSPDQRREIFCWMDVFAVSQHPGAHQADDLKNLETAVEEAGKRDGTLLVLDPKGLTLTRIWCLLEVWRTAEVVGSQKLRILSNEIDGQSLRNVWQELDVAKAQATMESDRRSILARFEASSVGISPLNEIIKAALMSSAATESERATNGQLGGVLRAVGAWDKHAMMLHYCAAEYGEAEALYRKALEIREAELGPEHPATLGSLNSLAVCLMQKGSLAEAEPLYRRTVGSCEATLGATHSNTLQSMTDLAGLLVQTGAREEAEELYRKALEGWEGTLGAEHHSTLSAVNGLAVLLKQKGDLEGAKALSLRAMEGTERSLGADHVNTLQALNNMAALLWQMGRLAEAEPLFRRGLEGRQAKLGASHPDTLASVNALAALLANTGDLQGAKTFFQQALEGREERLGKEHPDVYQSCNNLASVLWQLGSLAEAEPLFRRALAGREALFGADHPEALQTVHNLGALEMQRGNAETAEAHFRRALEGREAALGAEHQNTMDSLNNLANLYLQRGDFDAAEPMYKRVLEFREAKLGPDHPNTLDSLNNLSVLLMQKGNYEAAEPVCRRTFEIRVSKLGLQHPDTNQSVHNLVYLLTQKGDLVGVRMLELQLAQLKQQAQQDGMAQ